MRFSRPQTPSTAFRRSRRLSPKTAKSPQRITTRSRRQMRKAGRQLQNNLPAFCREVVLIGLKQRKKPVESGKIKRFSKNKEGRAKSKPKRVLRKRKPPSKMCNSKIKVDTWWFSCVYLYFTIAFNWWL